VAGGGRIPAAVFDRYERLFSRFGLAGLDWGDISRVLGSLEVVTDWSGWHRRWSELGHEYAERAVTAFAAHHVETGRMCTRKAAACHHFAEFMLFDHPAAKHESRLLVTEVFERGRPHLREQVHPITVPYAGFDLPGYLMTPQGNGPWPCVVLVNGLDSAKEVELHAFARAFLARGLAAVVFDGPGQGAYIGEVPPVVDFENVVAAVLAHTTGRPEVDADRVAIFGVSFGGYLATRAAALVPGFRACVNLSGGFDLDHFAGIPERVRHNFRFVFRQPDDEAMRDFASKWLTLRAVPPLRTPLLLVHGDLDTTFPLPSAERIMDWAVGPAQLIRYTGESHIPSNFYPHFIPELADWLSEHLIGPPVVSR